MSGYSENQSSRFSESHARVGGGGGAPVLVFSDNFARADSPTLGAPWVNPELRGTIGIVGDEATTLILGTDIQAYAMVDMGTDQGTASTTLPASLNPALGPSVAIGLVMGWVDINNYDLLFISANGPDPGSEGLVQILSVVGGVVVLNTNLGPNFSYAPGTVWSVVRGPLVLGKNMQVLENGSPLPYAGSIWFSPNAGHFSGITSVNTPAPFAVSDLFTFTTPGQGGSRDYGSHQAPGRTGRRV